ncbi:MAG: plasmid recombination protein [Oribacterium sp.]|nr:plasmid recombination protein [Oribacterium sp.]
MHVEKYNRGVMGHMLGHYDRTHPGSKSQIDDTKTHLNYNLAAEEQPLPQLDFIHQRLTEVKVHKRKDVNVFCDWVVTAPKELSEHEYDTFFNETYSFMSKRYGKDNVISAYVHMDESQPHMHFAFIPVTTDKKKNIPKLCAKEVLTKTELRAIHKDMSQHMERVFGRDIGILNGATALGNVTVDMLRENKKKVEAVHDSVIREKTTELERVRNSAAGKIFKKDTVTISGEELKHLQDVMQQSTAITDNVENIIRQANAEREKAELERKRSEELHWQALELCREEQKKAESKTAELNEREHDLEERSRKLDIREKYAESKEAEAQKQERENNERSKELDRREKEILERTDEPFGYYNSLLHVRDNIIADDDHKIRQLTADNRNKDGMIKQLRENIGAMITSHKQEISSLRERHNSELAEKDREISEKNSLINMLNATINKLKYKLDCAFNVVTKIVMAVSELTHNPKGEENVLYAGLGATQEKLIDGITEYAAKAAENEGFDNYAESIRTKVDLCDEIYYEMFPEDIPTHNTPSISYDAR